MGSKPDPAPVGTGQQGASTPGGTATETDTATPKPSRADRIADEAARKGISRERRDDATEFTK